jgi:hypothetical protein
VRERVLDEDRGCLEEALGISERSAVERPDLQHPPCLRRAGHEPVGQGLQESHRLDPVKRLGRFGHIQLRERQQRACQFSDPSGFLMDRPNGALARGLVRDGTVEQCLTEPADRRDGGAQLV